MTVTVQDPFNEHTANGATTAFAFEFRVISASHLVVTVDGETVPDSDYTVEGVGEAAGGAVTFDTAPADGATVLLQREVPLERAVAYTTNGPFPAVTVNQDFDLIWMVLQALWAKNAGVVRAPYPETLDDMPAAASRANTYLAFDADGNPIASTGTGADAGLRGDLAQSDGASRVAWMRSGAGPVIRVLESKLGDFLHIGDFIGASEFDNVSDYTSDVLEALLWVKTRNYGGKLILAPGSCPISATLPLDISGLHLVGEGADEARTTWGKWPTRLKWIGGTNTKMLEIDSSLSGLVRGGTIQGIVLDAQSTSGVHPLYANPSSAHWKLKNVCARNYGAGNAKIYLGTSCYGWEFDDVEIFNSQFVAIDLEGLNHHTTFKRLRGSGTGITSATSLVRVGETDVCSNINFFACDLEAPNTTYQVELLNARAVAVMGGYSEVASSGVTAIFRLGVTGTTACNGFSMNGFFVQGNDPTYTGTYALDIKFASGVDIGGGNHFRNLTNAVVNSNSVACPDSRFGAGNYLENCGGTGNKVKFAGQSTGWSFHDKGTTTPTVVGTGGTANAYTTQKCQWWVRDGRCFFDLEITLSALNATGPLTIETSIPYTAAGSYDYVCNVATYSGFTLAAGSHLRAYVTRGTNDINLREQVGTGSGDTTVLNTEASATLSLRLSGEFPISVGP